MKNAQALVAEAKAIHLSMLNNNDTLSEEWARLCDLLLR
jgi:hypothetical protein